MVPRFLLFCLLPDFFQFVHIPTFPFETRIRKMSARLAGPRAGGNWLALESATHHLPLFTAPRDSVQG